MGFIPLLLLTGACQTADDGNFVGGFTTDLHTNMGSIVVADWVQTFAATSWLEFQVDDQTWLASPPTWRPAGIASEMALGIPFGTDVALRVAWDTGQTTGKTETQTITTDPVPEGIPEVVSAEGMASQWDTELSYLLVSMDGAGTSMDANYWTFIIDRQGRVVWAMESPEKRTTVQAQSSHDGTDLLIDHNSFWQLFDGGAKSQVVRVKIDGTVVETILTPGLYHPFVELGDGSVAWTQGTSSMMDILTVHAPTGEDTTVWDCELFYESLGESEPCASNSIWWDESTDRFVISFFTTESIVEIDHQSGTSIRWFGHLADAWAFEPEESAFYWQHGAHYTSEGNLLVSAQASDTDQETVVREYALDENNESLVEVWSFGEGEGVFGEMYGEAHRLPNGNTLHNYGTTTRIREVTSDGTVVWDVLWDEMTLGRSTPLADLYAFAP